MRASELSAGAEVDVTKFEPGDDCNMIRLARIRPMAAAAVVDWLNASRQLVLCSQWPADTREALVTEQCVGAHLRRLPPVLR